ncbi:hypothetical protein HDU98_001247 [Podochytrium sp. JEL0797]|nr:hypothetical protein HDU98_001247 [Podochytrium sp. JEL0797]
MCLVPCPVKYLSGDIVAETITSISTLFGCTRAHPERLIYGLAGTVFTPNAPPPWGGPRMRPGYVNYSGHSANDLLEYIVTGAYNMYWFSKDKRVLEFVSTSVNKVLAMQYRGRKDPLDERLLQGLKKAGHIDWQGATTIPDYLAHVNENSVRLHVKDFTPRRRSILEEQNQVYGEVSCKNHLKRRRHHGKSDNRSRNVPQSDDSASSSGSNNGNESSNGSSGGSNSGNGSGSGESGESRICRSDSTPPSS